MEFTNKNVFELSEFALEPEDCLTQRKKPSMPPIIIDLRSPEDYSQEHLIGAHSLPALYLKDYIQQLPPYATIILYGSDDDSKTGESVKLLRDNNFSDLKYVKGGYAKLIEALKNTKDEVFLKDFPEEEWSARIEDVLNKQVRPALAADGGGLTLERIEGDKVFINYQGACSGCPSSTTGTLNFIRNSLSVSLNHEIEVAIA